MSYLRKKFETQENQRARESQEAAAVQQSQEKAASRQSQEVPASRKSQQVPQSRQSQETPVTRQSQEVPASRKSQQMQQSQESQQYQAVPTKRRTQDVPLSKDEEVAEIKLKNAFKLIKEERYGAARHILRDLPDHPKAQQLMAMMEGKTDKNKGPAVVSKWGLFIIIFVVVAVVGAIGASLFVQSALSQFTLGELFTQGMGGGDMATYNAAQIYCLESVGMGPNNCVQWPSQVYGEYYETLDACFAPYVNKYSLTEGEMGAIRNCLDGYGVPAPY